MLHYGILLLSESIAVVYNEHVIHPLNLLLSLLLHNCLIFFISVDYIGYNFVQVLVI